MITKILTALAIAIVNLASQAEASTYRYGGFLNLGENTCNRDNAVSSTCEMFPDGVGVEVTVDDNHNVTSAILNGNSADATLGFDPLGNVVDWAIHYEAFAGHYYRTVIDLRTDGSSADVWAGESATFAHYSGAPGRWSPTFVATPLPATLPLFGGGLGLLAWVLRMRRTAGIIFFPSGQQFYHPVDLVGVDVHPFPDDPNVGHHLLNLIDALLDR